MLIKEIQFTVLQNITTSRQQCNFATTNLGSATNEKLRRVFKFWWFHNNHNNLSVVLLITHLIQFLKIFILFISI